MNDMNFKIDRKHGVVVCTLYNCRYIAINRIEKYTSDWLTNDRQPKYYLKDCYVGVAKCASEDEFDEQYGKKLALTRAKIKRNKAINDTIKKYIHCIAIDIKRLADYGIHEVNEEKW